MAKVIRQRKKQARELVGPAMTTFLKTGELVPAGPAENPFDIFYYPALKKAWAVLKDEFDEEWAAKGLPGRPYGYEIIERLQIRQERRRKRKKENEFAERTRQLFGPGQSTTH